MQPQAIAWQPINQAGQTTTSTSSAFDINTQPLPVVVIPIVIMAAANGFVFEGTTFNYIAGMIATLCTPILAFVATAIVFWCDVNKPQREKLYAATGDSLTAD